MGKSERDALGEAFKFVLISPHFLLRVEKPGKVGGDEAVGPYDLAARLSYFLWASTPDDALLRAAGTADLSDTAKRNKEIARMLADPRSRALGDIFAGEWLGTHNVGPRIRKDPIDNPWCTESLMAAMRNETALFVHSLISENAPVARLIDADFTYLNAELARFYGISGVKGETMRRVKLQSAQRGGVFGHASVLAATSFPERTSPVVRGTWILTTLLGTPPPPPPPDVPEIEVEGRSRKAVRTLRQQLERHRGSPKCAGCHAQIDPLGFGLENYAEFGQWRGGVDNHGTLPNGAKFRGPAGLKIALKETRLDDLGTQIIRKMLAYGLGRQLEYYDETAVREIAAKLKPAGNRLAYLYFPNGSAEGSWTPRKVGAGGKLEPHKSDLIVTRNLWTPRGNGHGAGTATWLTGGSYNRRKNDVGNPSVDQIVARHLADELPLPSLELSTAGEGSFSGSLPRNCLSWTARDVPAVRDTIPRAVFDKLFRRAQEGFVNKSVLDLVLEQSKSLKRRASEADGRKIDEYLDSVRAIEKRLEFAEEQSKRAAADRALTATLKRPKPGIPTNHEEYVRQMLDLMALAFWSGATRVSTFMLDHGQSNRYFNFLPGVQGTWHALSHWKNASGRTEDDDGTTKWEDVRTKKDQYNEVTKWHHAQLAWFLARLKELKDADGASVLDRSMIVYGSSIADGHEHAEKNLPILVAGGGAGTIKPGRYLEPQKSTSMSRLHLGLAKRMGVPMERFAEAEEELPGL